MADRTNKAAGIKVISQVGRDPEANRYKRVKEEEEKLRADMRRDSKVKRMREKAPGRGLTTGYLEGGDSDEEGISIAAIKNKYKKNKKGGNAHPVRLFSWRG
jgi:RNA polymerase-associated protein LEO1